ncbi:MAG: hypothetical protein EP344_17135 [Bacteroidetes bacterium]|nr:MAG: hypothetical protein EP344_17135 [Bacteroidota bacterium]
MKVILAPLGLLVILFLVVLPYGCYWDNEEDLYGPDPTTSCDTVGMRYSVEIEEIMSTHCNSCHISTSPTYSGIPYESHAQLKAVADNGKLLDRINNQAAPMPETGLMSLCNRLKIEAWVKAGAPNN